MSRPPTYARKVDGPHKRVVAALRAMGCSVTVIQRAEAGLPDLLVGCGGVDHMLEVKELKKKRSDEQVAFAEAWRGARVQVVHSGVEAIGLVSQWRTELALRDRAAIALAHGVAASTGLQEGAGIAVAWSPVQKRSAPSPVPAARGHKGMPTPSRYQQYGDCLLGDNHDGPCLREPKIARAPRTLVVGGSGGVKFEVKR